MEPEIIQCELPQFTIETSIERILYETNAFNPLLGMDLQRVALSDESSANGNPIATVMYTSAKTTRAFFYDVEIPVYRPVHAVHISPSGKNDSKDWQTLQEFWPHLIYLIVGQEMKSKAAVEEIVQSYLVLTKGEEEYLRFKNIQELYLELVSSAILHAKSPNFATGYQLLYEMLSVPAENKIQDQYLKYLHYYLGYSIVGDVCPNLVKASLAEFIHSSSGVFREAANTIVQLVQYKVQQLALFTALGYYQSFSRDYIFTAAMMLEKNMNTLRVKLRSIGSNADSSLAVHNYFKKVDLDIPW